MVYFDNSSTTKVSENAAKKAFEMMTEKFGNPSSLHALGVYAERETEKARDLVAKRLSCDKNEVYFTSGGTESNNLAIFGSVSARKRFGNKIITTSIEHPSVLNAMKQLEKQGYNTVYLPVYKDGRIRIKDLEKELDDNTILVSIMLVNNETGAIQPVGKASEIIKQKSPNAFFHCDMVQGFGKIPETVKSLGADLISISGHKIHAPKGVGAIYIKKGTRISPVTLGGGQEKGIRSGTQSTPLIAAFGTAVSELPDVKGSLEKILKIKSSIQESLSKLDGVEINSPDDGLPFILNFSVEGIPSEVMIHFLESKEIFVSGGSACSKGARSHVLLAQGLSPKRVDSAIRVSFSYNSTIEEADLLVDAVTQGYNILRRKR